MRVDARARTTIEKKKTVLGATITWSEMGKTYRTYKLKRSIPTCRH